MNINKKPIYLFVMLLIVFSNATGSDSALTSAVQRLPYLTTPHATESETSLRIEAERIVQDLLNATDDSAPVQKMLQERGYQIHGKTLVNRFIIDKARYTTTFQEFLNSTNQKHASLVSIEHALKKLKEERPRTFRSPLNVYDIGCGNGIFSGNIVKVLSKLMAHGINDISFSGIDMQEEFVQLTNNAMCALNVASSTVQQGNFSNDSLESLPENHADLIFASHVCYTFSNMDDFITRATRIARTNAHIIFLHTSETPIDIYRRKFAHLLGTPARHNVVKQIEDALSKANIPYSSSPIESYVYFPVIDDAIWEQLKNVPYAQFDSDYSKHDTNFIRTKNLIEFYLMDPLEAFIPAHRELLLDAFKKMLVQYNYCIPIQSVMHVAILKPQVS